MGAGGNVSVISAATDKVTARVQLSGFTEGLAFDAATREMFVLGVPYGVGNAAVVWLVSDRTLV